MINYMNKSVENRKSKFYKNRTKNVDIGTYLDSFDNCETKIKNFRYQYELKVKAMKEEIHKQLNQIVFLQAMNKIDNNCCVI